MNNEPKNAMEKAQAVYYARNREELEESYDRWAEVWDDDATDFFGYLGPEKAFECIKRHADTSARILDAGAGTGRLGKLLYDAGYTRLTGFDLSKGMLQVAEQKGVYQALHHMALGERLGFDDHAFDVTACIGTLTTGHAPADSIDELIRVTRPDGLIVVTVNLSTYGDDGIKDRIEALVDGKRWDLVEASGALPLMPRGAPDIIHDVRVYRVLS